ncbi:MAG: hypothetical protein LUC93_14680 [Planctomycetaceae bacterium]|nr:hypothetical protein [Planctomycetaceae bacterium]
MQRRSVAWLKEGTEVRHPAAPVTTPSGRVDLDRFASMGDTRADAVKRELAAAMRQNNECRLRAEAMRERLAAAVLGLERKHGVHFELAEMVDRDFLQRLPPEVKKAADAMAEIVSEDAGYRTTRAMGRNMGKML